jgi:hypothetical protein
MVDSGIALHGRLRRTLGTLATLIALGGVAGSLERAATDDAGASRCSRAPARAPSVPATAHHEHEDCGATTGGSRVAAMLAQAPGALRLRFVRTR